MINNHFESIIKAIKSFDIESLQKLLDDNTSYMDVTKSAFLKKLDKRFKSAKKDNCYSFDDIFFGICESCNKGCEGMTFLSNSGYYLDFFIESENGKTVDDMYVCNMLTNFANLDKTMDLGFSFYEDEKVAFRPGKEYKTIQQLYSNLIVDLSEIKDLVSMDEIEMLSHTYNELRIMMYQMDMFTAMDYELYQKVNSLIHRIDDLMMIKIQSNAAADGMIDFQNINDEREKLIWLFKNQENKFATFRLRKQKSKNDRALLKYKLNNKRIHIDIEGYEYVLDYLKTISKVEEFFMDKYNPLPEHYSNSEDGRVECSLESYLILHNVHLDILEKYNSTRER